MKISIITLTSLFLSFISYSQNYSKCKVLTSDEGLIQLNNLGITVDHGIRKKNTFFISDFSQNEIAIMQQNGFQVEVLIQDVVSFYQNQAREHGEVRNALCSSSGNYSLPVKPINFQLGSMGGFFTYEEAMAHLDQMANLYPELVTIKAPIGTFESIEGRSIYWVKISDNANSDETEPEVLYTSIHHAREPGSLSNTIFYMWYLLENYATNDEIKYLVDETEMYFVPIVNPDGYIYNQTTEPLGGGMWRKNRRANTQGTFGVDLNRNYSHGWGTTGISFDSSSDIYPGTVAFSEPETQAVKWFCEQRDFQFAFNAHTYSNLLLFPLGTETNAFAEDHDYFQSISSHMVQYNSFVAQKSSDLYPASGDSDDYMYMDDLNIKPKIFAFTPEIGSQEDGFWPVSDKIVPLCQDMIFPNLILAFAAHNYWTVKETDPLILSELTGSFTHTVQRLGVDNSPLNVSLEPIQNIESVGVASNYTLNLNETQTGAISYVLSPTIQIGEEVKYVLVSNFGTFIKRDTLTKTYGNPALQVTDNLNTIENWEGNWDLTSQTFVSASTSITESPSGNYTNDDFKTITYIPSIDLINASAAKIEFNAKWSIEENYDYVAFEVSIDNGTTWIPQCGKFTNAGTNANGSVQPNNVPIYDGFQQDWVLEEISLNDYLGSTVKVRFIFVSDGGVTDDGFYFDDFKIYYSNENNSNGLNEFNKLNCNLFPNPSSDLITIAFEKSVNKLNCKLLDVNGKTVLTSNLQGSLMQHTINVENLVPGVYYLNLEDENGLRTVKKVTIIRPE